MAEAGAGISRKDAILDAAEALFAEHGYDAVTLRVIAARAGVDVALASYHFGRKHELFEQTFQRRAELLNAWRLEALKACRQKAAPDAPGVRDIIDAYLRPLMTGAHLKEPGWRNYYGMVAYVNSSAVWGGQLMTRFFDPAIREFIRALREALPSASDEAIYWGYHCLSGALTLAFAQTGRLDHLSNRKVCSTDLEGGYRQMVDFITAGFERIAE